MGLFITGDYQIDCSVRGLRGLYTYFVGSMLEIFVFILVRFIDSSVKYLALVSK